jgi:transposase InsO family protein
MNRLTQEAKNRQGAVKYALNHGKSASAQQYGVSLSSIKRWCNRYDGTWQSLKERSHRPHSHPKQHTLKENSAIRTVFGQKYPRYGWDGVYDELITEHGYSRSFSGMYYAAKRLGLGSKHKPKRHQKEVCRYPELTMPGEKVQVDVKHVPYNCLKGAVKRDGKRLYQYTAIDECTRFRFVYAYDEHTPANSIDFLNRIEQAFVFPIKTIQTDNGTEFTYRFISDTTKCPFEHELVARGINHKLIPPRTPWKNGKVERSHRNDQRYFYDWEKFASIEELNKKLQQHLIWSNNKTMRTLERKSPIDRLSFFYGSDHLKT